MYRGIDAVLAGIEKRRYHNHRLEEHSDFLSAGILNDLKEYCDPLQDDLGSGRLRTWHNLPSRSGRNRRIDLLLGTPDLNGNPEEVRAVFEHKSVITAHRNRGNRFDDLNGLYREYHQHDPKVIVIGTVLVGVCERVLNVPDQVKKRYRRDMEVFERNILPRLSSGDHSLWEEFPEAVSDNRPSDPHLTVDKFRSLPTRRASDTHLAGYDYLLVVPVEVNNVDPPRIAAPDRLGIDAYTEYRNMIKAICEAYLVRWRPDAVRYEKG